MASATADGWADGGVASAVRRAGSGGSAANDNSGAARGPAPPPGAHHTPPASWAAYDTAASPFLDLGMPFTPYEAVKLVVFGPLLILRCAVAVAACCVLACFSWAASVGQCVFFLFLFVFKVGGCQGRPTARPQPTTAHARPISHVCSLLAPVFLCPLPPS